MDTPERSKISGGTPLSKFEDSPVFNFINNLSPIQPVKPIDSVHTAHTYQCLNFASFCSIFSSPHDNPPRETRILTRPPFTDFAKHEKFSENIGESSLCTEISDAVRPYRSTAASEENRTITCSLNEATIDPPDQCPTLSSPFAQSMQNDSGSPDHNTTPKYSVKMDLKLDVGHAPVDLVDIVQNGIERQKILFAMETGVPENHPLELSKDEMIECDWENLISDDAADMLIFDSSTESEAHKGVEENIVDNDGNLFVSLLSNCTENADYLQQTQPDISHDPCVQNITQDPPNCDEDSMKEHETHHATKMQSGTHQNQVDNHQQRGMRRRCLVYEVAGVSKRNIYSDSNLNPSTPLPSKGKSICDTNSLKPTISPSLCALPGIGLHLNTLATTSKDRMINKETLASDKSMPCFIDPFLSTTAGMNRLRKSLAIENDLCPSGKTEDLQIILHDASKETTLGNCEELSQGSPKKKRRKSENGGESEGCKRCNCKKSKCLKLYCECFAAGVYCSEPCSCQGCLNKPIHEETVLATRKQIESRNPLAFAPKVIRTSDAGLEMGDDDNKTPASARHKRGCNCKKSNCLKKYCECYQGGVGCSISCRCEGCKNAFGRKYGVEEIEQMKEETNACDKEKESLNVSQQTANIQIEDHHSSGNILTITPLQSCRLSVEPSLLSSAKPLQSTKLSIGCSPGSYGSHMLRKSEMLLSQHKLENNVNTILEDDTPAILRPCASPNNGVKIASPNRKRVSPPRNGVGLSPPNRKGCRKLILKSIPSFPSLNSDVSIEYPVNYSNSSFNSSTVS